MTKKVKTRKIKPANLAVGDVAKRSGVSVATLHFYEEKDLIHSVRNAGNQRRYTKDVLRRIAVIKAAQQVGISLKNIKQAMSFLPTKHAPDKGDWQKLSKQWNDELNQKIQQLSALRDHLSSCIGCGCLSLKACPLYNPNDELGEQQAGAVLLQQKAQ
ncbi:redox-sensitive transcriptional activator SoxR [Marinicella sp. S1101]|uniref:redox-sensitive transcriptional activator SoxR n=1 Tax=Marinicella marina TaxID=2996016 RepID=UPI0022609FDB|nr:redox-sensitive transcriptional activator SoxR [Marinicella marina]MCX7552276.1 redox-sensitive transcriptional activator SoxR [Marinicella marina]MDJ1139152.1 redox-sensitive transcriptional activator SoxR [Marinicella marina]